MTEEESKVVREEKTTLEKYKSEILAFIFGFPVITLFLLPVITGRSETRYVVDSFAFVFLFAAMALTLNLEVGYLGLPNFGKVAFIMIGAYSYAMVNFYELQIVIIIGSVQIFRLGSVALGIIAAIVITGLSGILLTLPTLRLKEDYFAIVTIVAGEILRLVANNEKSLGGFSGFPVTNIVFANFDPDQFVGGKLLGFSQLVVVLLIITLSILTYYFYYPRYDKIFDEKIKVMNYALSKSLFVAGIGTVIAIYLNYIGFFGNQSISLDIFTIGFAGFILLIKFSVKALEITNTNFVYAALGGIAIVPLISYLVGVIREDLGVSRFNNVNWYFTLLSALVLLIVYIIMEQLYYSPFGRALRAIREDDTSAVSIGKGIFDFRLKGLILSNALTGFVAAFYSWLLTTVSPQAFLPLLTFQLYIMVIIGGSGNNKGVIFGAIVVQLLIQTTRRLSSLEIYYPFFTATDIFNFGRRVNPFNLALIIVGVTLVIFLIYAPEGIFPEQKNINDKYIDLVQMTEKIKDKKDIFFNLQKMVVEAIGTKIDLEPETMLK